MWTYVVSIRFESELLVREIFMISRRSVALALTIALLSGPAWSASGNAVKTFDTDNDGTLDLAEVKKAAAASFAKLDPDHDGTLDARELRGRLTAKELAAADPDRDRDSHARRISLGGGAALQRGESRQGWNAGWEGAELARRPCAAALVAVRTAPLDWERRRVARERNLQARCDSSLCRRRDSRLAL
ncbi:hypothetical protein ACVWZW_005644 [Bradyrhizobium sp. F1.13.4]